MIKLISLAVALSVGVAVVSAQSSFGLRVGGGIYYPSNSSVRQLFGDQWSRFGFSPGSVRVSRGSRLDFDTEVISREARGNRLFLFAPTVGFTQSFDSQGDFVPYIAVRTGPAYADYRIGATTRREWRVNTNVELGATAGRSFRFYGRYDLFSKRNGLDFSGFSINAEWLFVSF